MVSTRVRMNKLGEFIASELRNRDMSARQFADLVKTNHSTITKAMYPNPPEPTLDFLVKLARATSTDLCALVALVKPDDTRVRPEVQLVADRIARLPPDKLEIIDGYLKSLLLKP